MADIDLGRLRRLRDRASDLLAHLPSDLKPFKHKTEANGFRRKPSSPSATNDVNVTTTCSCLMALALANRLHDVYGDKYQELVRAIFEKITDAPWMSSGLAENNAFTTTLVVRLMGFLTEASVLEHNPSRKNKEWEPSLHVDDAQSVVQALTSRRGPFASSLMDYMRVDVRQKLEQCVGREVDDDLQRSLEGELTRVVRDGHLSDAAMRDEERLGHVARENVEADTSPYYVAHANRKLLQAAFGNAIQPLKNISLTDVARELGSECKNFAIGNYLPSAAVVYWYVDGVARAGLDLPTKNWRGLCRFAANEFAAQQSRVVASDTPLMDPVAMAMAACLCARLRVISSKLALGTTRSCQADLPSTVELESSIVMLFEQQTGGIWPKYFPLFHYQDAGSNFCYTFEMLEAVLSEFGRDENRLLAQEGVIDGLEKAVAYCETNRLLYHQTPSTEGEYKGWNSGGDITTLREGQPESWATAVVHMFSWELVDVLSRRIQRELLDRYRARAPSPSKKLEHLLDIDLWLDGKPASLKTTLADTLVKTFCTFSGERAEHLRNEPDGVKGQPVSALLFGPPGTSKTEVAKAISAQLDWPLVEIDPSHFLKNTFQDIYREAGQIFEDAMDLAGVVILLDEMDALVQERGEEAALDTEGKFLTTYMLPKLAKLHDRGRVVFLMATNRQSGFDEAIKRAGRFDLLLCMGPPVLEDKCRQLHRFLDLKECTDQTVRAGNAIREYAAGDLWLHNQLSLYTYGEFKSLLRAWPAASVGDALVSAGIEGVRRTVEEDSRSVNLKWDELETVWRLKRLRVEEIDTKHIPRGKLNDKKIRDLPIVRYVLDRRETRRQY